MSLAAKPSKAPWSIDSHHIAVESLDGYDIASKDRLKIARVWGAETVRGSLDAAAKAEVRANAHLIAAAPALFAACEALLGEIGKPDGYVDSDVLDTARAALARARGEEEPI